MRKLPLIIFAFCMTILCWGFYGPVLHWGQAAMADEGASRAMLRPFMCVGLAYFGIGVIIPLVWLWFKGESGSWSLGGIFWSTLAGAIGAVGALGVILAFKFDGQAAYVMPLVFGGAPVVNSFLTITMAKRMKEIGPLFLTGLMMVLIGALTVLLFKPDKPAVAQAATVQTVSTQPTATQTAVVQTVGENGPRLRPVMLSSASISTESLGAFSENRPPALLAKASPIQKMGKRVGKAAGNLFYQILAISMTVICWGAYGPILHKGQAKMQNSRLRPFICVGLAYFFIAVVGPYLLLQTTMPELSHFSLVGTSYSLLAGAAGAIGALGIILAFNFGGKPIYVMPLIFGGAPVVSTLVSAKFGWMSSLQLSAFMAGLILLIGGSAMTLIFAPKSGPPKKKTGDAQAAEKDKASKTDKENNAASKETAKKIATAKASEENVGESVE